MSHVPDSLRDDIIELLPNLRAFAMSLSGNPAKADDLVQDTILKAWSNIDKFRQGTNLRAWLFTILRNQFYSDLRKRKREVEDVDDALAGRMAVQPNQESSVDLQDFRQAFEKLKPEQREALILVGASGFAYEEAAEICGCAVGTVKSRVNRARRHLIELLELDPATDLASGGVMAAAIDAVSPTGG
jgi:RNA polymerase sigma-70 factor (ECF subfamily)